MFHRKLKIHRISSTIKPIFVHPMSQDFTSKYIASISRGNIDDITEKGIKIKIKVTSASQTELKVIYQILLNPQILGDD